MLNQIAPGSLEILQKSLKRKKQKHCIKLKWKDLLNISSGKEVTEQIV